MAITKTQIVALLQTAIAAIENAPDIETGNYLAFASHLLTAIMKAVVLFQQPALVRLSPQPADSVAGENPLTPEETDNKAVLRGVN